MTLIVYFSATGNTAKLAKKISKITNGEIYEIKPKVPYIDKDLDWWDDKCRANTEMRENLRPEILGEIDISKFDTIFLGFPIWRYKAPVIINSFLEKYDFNDKIIIPFVTSGSSSYGDTNLALLNSCKGGVLKNGVRFDVNISQNELEKWVKNSLNK